MELDSSGAVSNHDPVLARMAVTKTELPALANGSAAALTIPRARAAVTKPELPALGNGSAAALANGSTKSS